MAQSAAQELFAKGVALVQAGDMASAEASFKACTIADPKHAPGSLNLGILLMNRRAFAEAEPVLRQAIALQPSVETVTAFANLMTATGRTANAAQCYQDILKSMPNYVPTLKRMAELCDARSDRRGARDYYKKAWDIERTDLAAGIEYGIASFADEPAETAATMDRLMAIAGDDSAWLKILNSLLLYKEFYERIKRGLMPYHATNLNELFFTYCVDDFALFRDLSFKYADQNPNDVGALIRKFTALFCSRDRRGAQECLVRFQNAIRDHIWNAVTFDPAYYRMLEGMTDDDLVRGLPPLQDVATATFTDQPVAYLSCNHTYFTAFAMPMIRSLADRCPGGQLHVHIMDATDEELKQAVAFCQGLAALTIAISVECPNVEKQHGKGAARAYYHAIRFIRYYQHLKRYNRTLWLMDVDALFNRDPRDMYRVLGDKNAAMRIRAGRFEVWNQFNACIVAATPTPHSILYFRLIAAYIAHFHQRNSLRWGIDQLAMYGVFEYLRDEGRAPTLAFLDDRAIDYDYRDDGIVWCNSGRNKFFHMNRNPDGSLVVDDPERAKSIKLFDKYCPPKGNPLP